MGQWTVNIYNIICLVYAVNFVATFIFNETFNIIDFPIACEHFKDSFGVFTVGISIVYHFVKLAHSSISYKHFDDVWKLFY